MIRRRNFAGLLIGLLVTLTLLGMRLLDPNTLSTLRGSGFDTLQRIWPRQNGSAQPVRIVDIDEASLKKLGQWPWPRTELAKLVNELNELGAAAIVFDIIFPEPDRMSPDRIFEDPAVKLAFGHSGLAESASLPNNDAIFAKAISGRPVVLAFAGSAGALDRPLPSKAGFAQTGSPALNAVPTISHVIQNIAVLNEAAPGLGDINLDLRGDQGITRQIPLLLSDGKSFYPSLVLESLRIAQSVDTYVVNASPDTENAIDSIRIGELEFPVADNGNFRFGENLDLFSNSKSCRQRFDENRLLVGNRIGNF